MNWLNRTMECPSCQKQTQPGRFCGECGKPLPGATIRCGGCGAEAQAAARFCGLCGQDLSKSAAPRLSGNTWARRADDFATRVDVDDVEGFFKKGLIVEAGTRALFFTNGAYSGVLEAGRHEMGGLLQRINNVFSSKRTSAVLVDAADVEVRFDLGKLQTRDPLRLDAACQVVLRVDDSPVGFYENLMKGQQSYPLAGLQAFLAAEVGNAAQEFVGRQSVTDLSANLAVKEGLEQAVAAHLSRTLQRKGLQLVQVRVLEFRHPRMNELGEKLEEYWLDAQELQTRYAGGQMRDGIERKVLDQETARALMEVEVFEERAKVYERMRDAVTADRTGALSSEAGLEDIVAEIDKRKLLREDDVATLRHTLAERGEDREVQRAHLLQQLKVRQDAELEHARLRGTLLLQTTAAEHLREQEILRSDVENEKRRRGAKTADEIARLEAQRDIDEARAGLELLKTVKGIKGDEADRDLDRQLKAERDRHTRELERYRELVQLGPDALISFAPADRAALLSDLRRTEMLKGMSEDQILAMQAGTSPHVAEALKERFKSDAGRQALEQLVHEKERHYQQTVDLMREQSGQFKGFAERALDTMRDTAVAATRAGQPGMTVVTPGMTAGVVQTGVSGSAGRMMLCPSCRRDVPGDQNFCNNCGHRFTG